MVKKFIAILLVGLASLPVCAQTIVFPPELRWWLDEVQKANPALTLDDFKLVRTKESALSRDSINPGRLYPIFKRWNFSGDTFAYLYPGAEPTKTKNGKYSLSFDIDSAVYIIKSPNQILYHEGYGSTSGMHALAWLTDSSLVGVGVEIESVNQDKAWVNLIIKVYKIEAAKIIVSTYAYKHAFDNAVRSSLNLHWYEQRPDYFELK